MSKCVIGLFMGAALLAVTVMPAPAAARARCDLARDWVADHCGAGMSGSAEGTPWRCKKARTWIADHCAVRSAKLKKARYADDDRPVRQRKYRAQTVYVYVERPRDCCYREYRPTRVRGALYYADRYDGWTPRKFWKDQERYLP